MSWQTPITDRTFEDVELVKDLNEKLKKGELTGEETALWLSNLKGAFNTSDMERIVSNITLLDAVLETELELPTVIEFPTHEWFTTVLSCVDAIRDAYMTHVDTPGTPSSPINDYTKLNDIEKILEDVYTILNSNFFYYTGDIYAGDTFGLLL